MCPNIAKSFVYNIGKILQKKNEDVNMSNTKEINKEQQGKALHGNDFNFFVILEFPPPLQAR